MGIVIRQSLKTSLVVFSGALLGAFINYVYAFVFNKTEIGFVTNLVYQAALIQVFTIAGTSYLMLVYNQKYPVGSDRRKMLIAFCLLLTFLAYVLFLAVYALLHSTIINKYQLADRPYIEKYYWVLPILVASSTFMNVIENYLISLHKVAASSFIREVTLRILNIIFILLAYNNIISFDQFVWSLVISYVLPAIAMFYVATRTVKFGISLNFNVFKNKDYTEFIRFCWYHLLTSVSINVLGYMDVIMLAPLGNEGVASLAVYRIAVFAISIMTIPYKAISSASFPVLNRTYLENSKQDLKELFDRLGNNLLIVTVAMFVLIACNLDNVVAIFPKGYEAIKPIVLILMIGKLIDMATGMNNELISISKYYKFNFRISAILVLLAFSLMRYMIPVYGIYGAAWAATIALAVFNIAKMIFLWVKLDLQPFNKNSLLIFLGGLLAYFLACIVPFIIHPIVDAIVRSIIITASYTLFLLLTGASPDLKDYLQSMRANRRLF